MSSKEDPARTRQLAGSERNVSDPSGTGTTAMEKSDVDSIIQGEEADQEDEDAVALDEKTPLLQGDTELLSRRKQSLPKRFVTTVIDNIRYIVTTVLTPGRYVIACFYDEKGRFSAALPVYRVRQKLFRRTRRKKSQSLAESTQHSQDDQLDSGKASTVSSMEDPGTTIIDEKFGQDTPSRHTRSMSASSEASETSDAFTAKRSIRIKTEDSTRRRKRREQNDPNSSDPSSKQPALTINTIKSPTSSLSSSKLTKYPRAPAPPRPLIPKRSPSYKSSAPEIRSVEPRKTLIIDLDETLIHSMAKGGRMSTGHMVEVKLSTSVGAGGRIIGPQVPILYYVHKRPYCDEFLRKVSRWYNLVVFTASVQEYADPVIDWLEMERKYFTGRYYRQHCTYRNGTYIKDLGNVEPDLSKAIILDNSPMSYILNEDNAIPIEGWISDPTDNDLLHLIPLLEALQYTTDVRALLSLRLGESLRETAPTPTQA